LRTIACGHHALGHIPIVLVPAASVVHGRAAHRVSTRKGRLASPRLNLCMTTTMVSFSFSLLFLSCSLPHSHPSTHLRITTHASHPCVVGSICLSCWTSVTEADQATDLVFLVQGHELSLRASAKRWVLFMGYIPHESRASDCLSPATTARVRILIHFPSFSSFHSFPFNLSLILLRSCHTVQRTKVHHSAFCKPEAEHLGAHILSHLPCSASGGDWCMNTTHRVRAEAFSDTNMIPVLARGSFESGTAVARDTSDARSSLMSLDDP
jgi:hypothetical protein